MPEEETRITGTLTFTRNDDGQWYWKFERPNGESVAIGGEGYHNKQDAEAGFASFRNAVQDGNEYHVMYVEK